jgi:hypothetical protein
MTSSGILVALVVAGCSAPLGPLPLVGRDPDVIPTKLLRPDAEGRSCRAWLMGIPLQPGSPGLDEALARVLALDPEGNVVTHAEVSERLLLTGIFNRRCVVLRGDLSRTVASVTLPTPEGYHTHGAR